MAKTGLLQVSVIFLSLITETLQWELFGNSEKFWQRENCMVERGFSVAIFLYHSFEKFIWEPYVVSKNFWQRNHFTNARRLSAFYFKPFLSHIVEKLHEDFFVVPESFWELKIFMDARGFITFSRRKRFELQYRKSSLRTVLWFKKFLVARKLHGWDRWVSRFAIAIVLYHSFRFFH